MHNNKNNIVIQENKNKKIFKFKIQSCNIYYNKQEKKLNRVDLYFIWFIYIVYNIQRLCEQQCEPNIPVHFVTFGYIVI